MAKHIKDKTGEVTSLSTLKQYLTQLGFCYGKGNHVNILHGANGPVALRKIYLTAQFSNLTSAGLPILPKVFLDKLYCHVSHQSQLTWLPTGGDVMQFG